MLPNRSGNSGRYFSVLNCASENGLSLLTEGLEWVLVTPRSASSNATGFEVIEGPRSACTVSCPGPIACLVVLAAMSSFASVADWSDPQGVGQTPGRNSRGLPEFVVDGTAIAERRVKALAVVDLVDESRHVACDVGEILVLVQVHPFDLQRLDEALALRVVVRIAGAPHRIDQAVSHERCPVVFARVLNPAVGMMHAATHRSASRDCRIQSGKREATVDARAQREADHAARARRCGARTP